MCHSGTFLAKIRVILEQILQDSPSASPWPVRLADRSYPISYAQKIYFVPKEIYTLYHLLEMEKEPYVKARLSELAQECLSSARWLGDYAFFQHVTGNCAPVQQLFKQLEEALTNTAPSAVCIRFKNTIDSTLQKSKTTRPWPVGIASQTNTIGLHDRNYQVPHAIYRLYELINLHTSTEKRAEQVKKCIQIFQKSLDHEKKAWRDADIFDMPFLYTIGMHHQNLHEVWTALSNTIPQAHEVLSTTP